LFTLLQIVQVMTQAGSLVIHRIHGFENLDHFQKRGDVLEKSFGRIFF
jgi:hypothetical protein